MPSSVCGVVWCAWNDFWIRKGKLALFGIGANQRMEMWLLEATPDWRVRITTSV